jgi:hypothetical protein
MTFRHGRERGIAPLVMIIAVMILGFAFVMTLKGVALVHGARAFIAANKFRQFQDQILLYENQYRALPGDDRGAPNRWGRPNSVYIVNGTPVSYVGDLRIHGLLSDYGNATGEQFDAWRDLRFSGLLDGDKELVGQSAMPENPFGGVYGFAEDNLGLKDVICATQVPGDAAAAIDRRLDNGVINTGIVQATSRWDPVEAMNHFEAPDEQPYDPLKTYIICVPQRV